MFNYVQGVLAVGQRKGLIIAVEPQTHRSCNPIQCKHFDCVRNKAVGENCQCSFLQQFVSSGEKKWRKKVLKLCFLIYGGAKDLREGERRLFKINLME